MNVVQIKSIFFAILFQFLFLLKLGAQNVPQGITYQGLARHTSGLVISNQTISVKLGIYSSSTSGVLEWEEIHNVVTSPYGLFYFIIGQGGSTGMGAVASFNNINWGGGDKFILISMDETGGNNYVDIDTMKFWSVPYALYSGSTSTLTQLLRLNDLADVDTLGVGIGDVLKWNGSLWKPGRDNNSDTALFAYNNSNHSIKSDTSDFAWNILGHDTVLYSTYSDTSKFSLNSSNSINSIHSVYTDTATYALNSLNSWNLNGNSGTNPNNNFIGTIDNTDLVFKTNNTERMRVTSNGRFGLGTSSPQASLHIVGNDGLIAEGAFGLGSLAPSGGGTRMLWSSKKGAFRAGGVISTNWNDANIGNYSFAGGYNTKASGSYSTAFGYATIASGDNSLAGGDQSQATGFSSISLGSVCYALAPYSVAMVRGATASDSGAIALGYHNKASGKYSLSFGSYTVSSGNYSTTMGYLANTNGKKGSFVYADYSSTTDTTYSTADNQFVVRAAGGTVFYSNAALTAGVSLPAGGGSWTSISDKNKKQNFKCVDGNVVLNKISNMDISSWNYKSQNPSIRHIGPMAQDFYKAFNFGESDSTISTVDIDGINLIALKTLALKTVELNSKFLEIKKLKQKIDKLEEANALLEKRIVSMEKKQNLQPYFSKEVSVKAE